jgi:hypothetical protein
VKAGSSDVLSAKIKLADSVHLSTTPDMPSLHPDPGFEYYFKACRKGDPEAKAVAIGESPVRLLADANEITGLPRDNFEVWEITREEFERATAG